MILRQLSRFPKPLMLVSAMAFPIMVWAQSSGQAGPETGVVSDQPVPNGPEENRSTNYSDAAKQFFSKAWNDLWQTPDQQKRSRLEKGDYQSLRSSDDPMWSGIGEFKTGRFEEATQKFDQSPDITSQYNAATSMIHGGQYQEAIDKLNQVLEAQPNHQKARHNLDIAQQLMQLQEPPPPQGDDGESGDEQDQQGQDQQQAGNENSGEQQNSEQQGENDSVDGSDDQSESQQDQPGQEQTDSEQDQNPESSDSSAQQDQEQSESSDGDETQSSRADNALSEDQQATEQWLRRIPDDPTGLLRRKLRRSHQSEYPTTTDSTTPW